MLSVMTQPKRHVLDQGSHSLVFTKPFGKRLFVLVNSVYSPQGVRSPHYSSDTPPATLQDMCLCRAVSGAYQNMVCVDFQQPSLYMFHTLTGQ